MRAISFILLLLSPAAIHASPFTFPSQPAPQRHDVTLTAQDGRPSVLTTTQATTGTSTTTTLTPPTLPGSSGPIRTGRPEEEEEDDLALRAIFTPTGSSGSALTSSPLSEDEESNPNSGLSSGEESDTEETNPKEQAATAAVASSAQTTTMPPASDPAVAAALADQGYSQATYYTCVTRGAMYTHCGWHVPVEKVSGAAAVGNSGRRGVGVVVALGLACVVVGNNILFGG